MSTQNIWDNNEVLQRYERILIEQGNKFMLKRRFNLGHFDMNKLHIVVRLSDILCKNACSHIPYSTTTKELLNKILIKL